MQSSVFTLRDFCDVAMQKSESDIRINAVECTTKAKEAYSDADKQVEKAAKFAQEAKVNQKGDQPFSCSNGEGTFQGFRRGDFVLGETQCMDGRKFLGGVDKRNGDRAGTFFERGSTFMGSFYGCDQISFSGSVRKGTSLFMGSQNALCKRGRWYFNNGGIFEGEQDLDTGIVNGGFLIDGVVYVGSSKGPLMRLSQHKSELITDSTIDEGVLKKIKKY